jgi:cytoskeletal protein RodZ
MPSLGESFRDAREARGFALSDVAEQIHIRSIYLSSIENEDWAAIGAPVYARGFIRTYARFLGLDAEAAVAHFNEWAAAERPVVAAASHSGSSERGGPSVWVIAIALVAVVLVAFAGYEYVQYQAAGATGGVSDVSPQASRQPGVPTPAPTASTATEAVVSAASSEPSPEASVPPATSNSLDIKLTQRCWLRVVVDGKSVMEGLFPAGTMRSLTGNAATIRAGNAGGVSVTVNGKSIGALGGSGDVVERSFNLRGD